MIGVLTLLVLGGSTPLGVGAGECHDGGTTSPGLTPLAIPTNPASPRCRMPSGTSKARIKGTINADLTCGGAPETDCPGVAH